MTETWAVHTDVEAHDRPDVFAVMDALAPYLR